MNTKETSFIKWPEIISLGALNAAVVISWLAYNEYQPVLLESFGLTGYSSFLVITKALVLVFVPVCAGLLADYLIRKNNGHFIVLLTGVGITGMVFMTVASLISLGPDSPLAVILPAMVVLWLISMNIFHSPANSLLELFAPAGRLPLVMGVLVMITELIFALEPVIIDLIRFIRPAATFALGGVLIGVAGFVFKRISANEVSLKRNTPESRSGGRSNFIYVILAGLFLGAGHALLQSIYPDIFEKGFGKPLFAGWNGNHFACLLLGTGALSSLPLSMIADGKPAGKSLFYGVLILGASAVSALFFQNETVFLISAFCTALAFTLVSIAAFPFAIQNLSIRSITAGTGIFFGSSEIFVNLLDVARIGW